MSRRIKMFFGAVGIMILAGIVVRKMNPLVCNESFFMHAHCIKIADGELEQYAITHDGNYPFSTNGYGDALLALKDLFPTDFGEFTAYPYDKKVFLRAIATNGHVAEADCGRVYVQGLNTNNVTGIAILFDKVATRGGDHWHGLSKFSAPLGREVIGVPEGFIQEKDWPAFAANQIELLVKVGISRERARELYAQAGVSW